MTKLVKIATIAGALTLPTSAYAHDGDHTTTVAANVMHWLASPSHALFAVLGGLAVSALIIRAIRKSRA